MPAVACGDKSRGLQCCLRLLESCPIIGCGISAIWACMGLGAEAFRAFIWSAIGFVPILNIYRFLVVCIRYSKAAPKEESLECLKVETGVPFSSWMGHEAIRNKTLLQLTIPGSHNSMATCCPATNPYVEKWSVCQHLSILGQLRIGVRFFDIRITDCGRSDLKPKMKRISGDERLWASHARLCMPLKRLVTELHEFTEAKEATDEIIVIQLAGDVRTLTHEAWVGVRQTFLDGGFHESEFMVRDDLGKTLSEIRGEGKRLLFLVQSCPASDHAGDEVAGYKDLVDQAGLLYGSWVRTNSSTGDQLSEKMSRWMDDNTIFSGSFLFKAQVELTPDKPLVAHSLLYVKPSGEIHFNLEEATQAAHRVLIRGLTQDWRGKNFHCFMTTDFVRPELCEAIISMNFLE